jgi:hypothetical protein
MGGPVTYTPTTDSGERWRASCYWFATGWWFAQDRTEFVPDFSSDFSYYGARLADDYRNEHRTSLPSIPDMWKDYLDAIRHLDPH